MGLCFLLIGAFIYTLLMVRISASIGFDLQSLIRVPVFGIKFIDVAIGAIAISVLISLTRSRHGQQKSDPLKLLIVAFIFSELVQLMRTFSQRDVASQLAWFSASLAILIILYLSEGRITPDRHRVLLGMTFAYAILLLFFALLFPLDSVEIRVTQTGGGVRQSFLVPGMKESLSLVTIVPIVLLHSFFSMKLRQPLWKVLVYLSMLVYLFISLVAAWHRGLFATWFIVIVFVVFQGSRISFSGVTRRVLKTALVFGVIILIGFSVSEGYFTNSASTIQKLARYTVSVDQQGWDKGRFYVQAMAIQKWEQKPWFGYGYEDLQRYMPVRASAAHNYFVTSLFQRGIVGTLLISSIFFICYARSIKLWRLSRHLEPREALLNKILVLAAWLWIIPLMTQEVMWERYSTSLQYVYFGFIVGLVNYYGRKAEEEAIHQEN